MNVLEKLKNKIEEWKTQYEAIKLENQDLKSQLANVASLQDEQQMLINKLKSEAERCDSLEFTIEELKEELKEKDTEIEKIIAQVEALLGD